MAAIELEPGIDVGAISPVHGDPEGDVAGRCSRLSADRVHARCRRVAIAEDAGARCRRRCGRSLARLFRGIVKRRDVGEQLDRGAWGRRRQVSVAEDCRRVEPVGRRGRSCCVPIATRTLISWPAAPGQRARQRGYGWRVAADRQGGPRSPSRHRSRRWRRRVKGKTRATYSRRPPLPKKARAAYAR